MVLYLTKAVDARKVLQEGYFHAGGVQPAVSRSALACLNDGPYRSNARTAKKLATRCLSEGSYRGALKALRMAIATTSAGRKFSSPLRRTARVVQ
ncbi:hypothetical protein VDGL01_12487 [Verticillium dahliae]